MAQGLSSHPADDPATCAQATAAPRSDERAASAPPPPRKPAVDLTRSGMSVTRYLVMHLLGALFPVTAGLILYGWRAAAAIVLVAGSAMISALIWRQIGTRGPRVHFDQILWLAVLTALTLPAQLVSSIDQVGNKPDAPWPVLVAAGAVLVMFVWVIGGVGSGRLHPVIITHLLIFVLFGDMLVPQFALRREDALWGDVLNTPAAYERASMPTAGVSGGQSGATERESGGAGSRGSAGASAKAPSSTSPTPPSSPASIADLAAREPLLESSKQAWITAPAQLGIGEAVRSIPAAQRLESFTGGHEAPERAWVSLESLVRDRLPPLEDLIVGGQPAPIGQGSAIALIIGGLFMLYRGLIDYRVPLLVLLSALVCFLVLPVPVVITESSKVWRWLALHDPAVGPALGVTFANYELMASPLVFVAFYLATSPSVRPLSRRARAIYAILVGAASAAFQLYASVMIGPYLALLAISLLTPWLDQVFRPRPLV